jgi:hypothetical protein
VFDLLMILSGRYVAIESSNMVLLPMQPVEKKFILVSLVSLELSCFSSCIWINCFLHRLECSSVFMILSGRYVAIGSSNMVLLPMQPGEKKFILVRDFDMIVRLFIFEDLYCLE